MAKFVFFLICSNRFLETMDVTLLIMGHYFLNGWMVFFELIDWRSLLPNLTNQKVSIVFLFVLASLRPYLESIVLIVQYMVCNQKCIRKLLFLMHNNLPLFHDCICIILMEPYILEYLKYHKSFQVSKF